jgi:hypothetical protein
MSSKLEIQNGSLNSKIFITLSSIDGNEIHLDNKMINTSESIESVVKGGTKRLIIKTNENDVFWEGVIPTYVSHPVMIYPEYNKVIYKDNIIPNMKNENNNTISTILTLITVLFLIIICYIYLR